MSEKKVVVPKEMLKCAINYTALPDGCGYDIVETILRRGLTYQSENPRVPTLEQWAECLTSIGLANNAILTEQMVPRKEIAAWIFRMYLAAPEPEYGVCKKCGARVQDGATKSHSSAAGTLFPGHTEPSVPEEKNPVIALREQFRDEMSIDDIEERAIERQQRLASVPEEIKNLHLPAGQQCPREQVNERIDEAYRRGKESHAARP